MALMPEVSVNAQKIVVTFCQRDKLSIKRYLVSFTDASQGEESCHRDLCEDNMV